MSKFTLLFHLAVFLMSGAAHAERIGLIVYDSKGSDDPRRILGHAAAYLPHICMDGSRFKFRECKEGEPGLALNRSEGFSPTLHLDWFAMPASVNLFGLEDLSHPPLMLPGKLAAKLACDYYHKSDLPSVINPAGLTFTPDELLKEGAGISGCEQVPKGAWASMAKTWFDSVILVTVDLGDILTSKIARERNLNITDPGVIAESKVQEAASWQKVIQYLNAHAHDPENFSTLHRNCAHLAQTILQVALGDFGGHGKLEDFMVESPLAVASGVKEISQKYRVAYQVSRVNQVPSEARHSFLPSNPMATLSAPRSFATYAVQAASFYYGAYFLGFTALRQFIPGFQIPHLMRPRFIVPSELKRQGDQSLASATAALKYSGLSHDEKTEQKILRADHQDEIFGSDDYWTSAEQKVEKIADEAQAKNLLADFEREKLRKSSRVAKALTHTIPRNPALAGQQNIDLVKDFTAQATFETTHSLANGAEIVMALPDGKRVGLSPSNVEQYDLALGLKALLISIYFDLDQEKVNRPLVSEFEAKLSTLDRIAQKLDLGSL